MFVLFLLLNFVNFAFAGEPIAAVAHKKDTTVASVRADFLETLRSDQCRTCMFAVARGAEMLSNALLTSLILSAFLKYNNCTTVCTDAFKIEDGYRYLDYQDQCIDINL